MIIELEGGNTSFLELHRIETNQKKPCAGLTASRTLYSCTPFRVIVRVQNGEPSIDVLVRVMSNRRDCQWNLLQSPR